MILSPQAQRILDVMREMAGDELELVAAYKDIAPAAHCSESFVAVTLRELKAVQAVQQIKGFGVKARYILCPADSRTAQPPPASPQGAPSEPHSTVQNCTEAYSTAPAVSAAVINPAAAEDLSPDFERLKGLLSEFGIGEPVQSELAKELAPKTGCDDDLRQIYATTREEWQSGKVHRLVGMTIIRLRDYAAGIPLTPVGERSASGAKDSGHASYGGQNSGRKSRQGQRVYGYHRVPAN
jgi:hypothetical protein